MGGSTCAISTLWTHWFDNWFNDVTKVLIKEDLAKFACKWNMGEENLKYPYIVLLNGIQCRNLMITTIILKKYGDDKKQKNHFFINIS